MRILYVSPRSFWPINSGARLRDYYMVRELGRRTSVSFFGICSHDEEVPSAAPAGLELEKWIIIRKGPSYTRGKLLRGFLGPRPITVLNYDDGAVAAALKRLLAEQAFDAVQVEGVHLSGYLPIIRSSPSRPAIVCDWHDVESDRMQRYSLHAPGWPQRVYAARTRQLLRQAERDLLGQCDAHLVVTERDRGIVREAAPAAQVYVVENGVDLAHYSETERQRSSAGAGKPGRKDILFVGSMDFYANIDAARYFAINVWPELHRRYPELRFLVVGSNPADEVLELSRIPGVSVTGTVDDVRPYYRDALAAVAPVRIAGGSRLKILEAMAAGVPVVATPTGAEGLAVTAETNILIADFADLGQSLVRLYMSPELQQRLSAAGHELVGTRYDWSTIGSSLGQIYQEVLNTSWA